MLRRGLAAFLIVVLASCSSDDDSGSEDDERSSTTESTATTVESTTTTEPACPAVEPPAGSPSELPADLDGDGDDDAVTSAAEGDDLVLVVELAKGGGARLVIPGDGTAPLELIGAAAVDSTDAHEQLWAQVGAGAATNIVGLFHLDGCELAHATFDDGNPVDIPIGGTVGTASGAECGPGVDAEADVRLFEATLAGAQYEVVTTEYRWDEGVLTLSPTSAPSVSHTDDPGTVAGFRCGNLVL